MADQDYVDRLIELRDRLKEALGQAEPNQVASLSREYRAVLAELQEIAPPTPAEPEKGSVDAILADAEARKSDATDPGSA